MDVKFKTKHIIMLSKILAKMDIKIEVKGKTQEALGADLLMDIAKNVYKAEPEFYELLADLLAVDIGTIADMEIMDLFDTLKVVVTELINFMKKRAA